MNETIKDFFAVTDKPAIGLNYYISMITGVLAVYSAFKVLWYINERNRKVWSMEKSLGNNRHYFPFFCYSISFSIFSITSEL